MCISCKQPQTTNPNLNASSQVLLVEAGVDEDQTCWRPPACLVRAGQSPWLALQEAVVGLQVGSITPSPLVFLLTPRHHPEPR